MGARHTRRDRCPLCDTLVEVLTITYVEIDGRLRRVKACYKCLTALTPELVTE